MKLRTLLLLTAMTATMSFATGCGKDNTDNTDGTPDATNEEGHGHEHGDGELAVGTVEIEGRTVSVNLGGELEAGKLYEYCHLTITGDDVDVMRVWIGAPSGEGALKARVSGLGDHPVVDLQAPADLEGAVLGIEIEVGGETYTATAELGEGHDHEGHDHEGHDHDDHEGHDHDGDGHDDHDHDHGDHDDHDH